MKKQIALLASAVLAVSMVTSCGKNNSSSQTGHKWENSETLNEWQKSLLEAQGLPTDIEQLSPTQKRSIQHIYEMITYLNDKYDEEFVYAGYIEGGLMEEERLFAYPKQYGADGGRNTVEVTVDDDGDFTDTYCNMEIRKHCEKLFQDFVRDYFNSDKVIVITSHFHSDIDELDDVKDDCFKNKVGGRNDILISSEICTESELEDFIADYFRWCDKHEVIFTNRILIMNSDAFPKINSSNFTDYYSDKYIIADYSLHLYGDHSYVTSLKKKLEDLGKNKHKGD